MTTFFLIGIVLAIVAFIGISIPMMFRTVVDTNRVHIVQSKSKTVSYGTGQPGGAVYYHWPSWVPRIGLRRIVLPVNNFSLTLDGYQAYDKDRVPFFIDVTSFFRIADTNKAAERIEDFEKLEAELEYIVQGAIRKILASTDINQIMIDRSTFGDQFTQEVREELSNWGVEPVKNMELMDIRDITGSQVIHNIMLKKISHIEMESRREVAENKKQAETAEIEALQAVKVREQEAQQAIGQRTAEAEKAVGIAQEKSAQDVKAEAAITKAREMEIARVAQVKAAEIQKETAIVAADQNKQTAVIDADAAKQTQIIEAEAAKQTQVIEADAKKQTQVIVAEGQKQSTVITAEGVRESAVLNAEGVKATTELTAQGQLTAAQLNAQGIEAEGKARGAADLAVKMAPVNAELSLAEGIGQNEKYQEYLIRLKTIERTTEATIEVGKAQAVALARADVKIIANTGDVGSGISKVSDLFTPKGGTALGATLEGLNNTPQGKALLDAVKGAARQLNGEVAEA
jgi:flotillin